MLAFFQMSRCLQYFQPPCRCPLKIYQHGGSILGSVKLEKIIRKIFEVWENVHLKLCPICLSPITLYFLGFIYSIVLELFFNCFLTQDLSSRYGHVILFSGNLVALTIKWMSNTRKCAIK